MYVKSFEFKNVGPFRRLSRELPCGLVGVFGPNGSGKSTMINLWYAALTNDFTSRFEGVKLDRVLDTAAKGEESYVRLAVAHEGREAVLVRGLSPARHELTIGDRTVTGDKKVQPELYDFLGVDRDLLDDFVFKPADKIYDFISLTDGKRAQTFQTLCRTQDCAELYDLFGAYLGKDAEVRSEVVDDSDEIAAHGAALAARADALRAEREALAPALLSGEQRKELRDLAVTRATYDAVADRVATLEAETDSVRARYEKAERALKSRTAKVDAAVAEVDRLRPAAESAEAVIKVWEARTTAKASRLTVKEELAKAVARLDAVKYPPKPELPDAPDLTPEQAHKRVAVLKDEVRRARAVVNAFDAGGVAECPLCGTPSSAPAVEAHVRECRESTETKAQEVKRLSDYIDAIDAWQAAWKKADVRYYDARESVARVRAQLAAIKIPPKPTLSARDARAAVKAFKRAQADYDTAEKPLGRRRTAYEADKAAFESHEKSLAGFRKELARRTRVPAKAAAKAEAALTAHDEASARDSQLRGQLEEIETAAESLRTQLKELRRKLKRSKRVRRMADVVAQAREYVHYSGIPNKVAAHNLARMTGEINDHLTTFGSPFWVEANEDLTFTVHMPGVPPFRAARLSTGQRVILAVPFWFATASLWRTKIGMLALDEPTANLDEENRGYLGDALAGVASAVRGNRQVVVVTHADNLRHHFDAVIDLGSP